MSNDRWEPLARISTTSEAIDGLRSLFQTEEPLDDASQRVAVNAARAIAHADFVSITVLTWPTARTTALTDDKARILDDQQYTAGRGPCLEAATQRVPVRGEMSRDQSRWPEFVEAAIQAGVKATLSVPLLVGAVGPEQETIGSLNMYSLTAAAFDPFDEALMGLFSVAAGAAITNARAWQRSRETVTQLEKALESRADIDMAKGVLMAIHGCTEAEAFNRLTNDSQHRNVKVRTIARELMASLVKDSG